MVGGLNHAFVYSPEINDGIGTSGSMGIPSGNGIGDINNDSFLLELPTGMTAYTFINQIKNPKLWNNQYFPGLYDCHTQLRNAFHSIGVTYPGAPNGRFDLDDKIKTGINTLFYQLNNPSFYLKDYPNY